MIVNLQSVQLIGTGLRRPECVINDDKGGLITSHVGFGVTRIAGDGTQLVVGNVSEVDGMPWIPNGIALRSDDSILVANMGEGGGVWRLLPDGHLEPFLSKFEGRRLPATNFVLIDKLDRVWVSVSTRKWPISEGFYPEKASDGFIILIDKKRTRIVADGLAFANEVRLDRENRFLYVAESFAGLISRFPVGPNGDLGPKENYITLPPHTYPDGIVFDRDNNLWVASIISNKVLKISPARQVSVVIEESDAEYLSDISIKLAAHSLEREYLASNPATVLRNPSSVCFGGPAGNTAYVGSLSGNSIVSFPAGTF